MAIFYLKNGLAESIKLSEFGSEKELQKLIESNLQPICNSRFIATQFFTGNIHAGRINTLAISEDNNPVIIEYKKVASSELVIQSCTITSRIILKVSPLFYKIFRNILNFTTAENIHDYRNKR
jgi:hypothetical protein